MQLQLLCARSKFSLPVLVKENANIKSDHFQYLNIPWDGILVAYYSSKDIFCSVAINSITFGPFFLKFCFSKCIRKNLMISHARLFYSTIIQTGVSSSFSILWKGRLYFLIYSCKIGPLFLCNRHGSPSFYILAHLNSSLYQIFSLILYIVVMQLHFSEFQQIRLSRPHNSLHPSSFHLYLQFLPMLFLW